MQWHHFPLFNLDVNTPIFEHSPTYIHAVDRAGVILCMWSTHPPIFNGINSYMWSPLAGYLVAWGGILVTKCWCILCIISETLYSGNICFGLLCRNIWVHNNWYTYKVCILWIVYVSLFYTYVRPEKVCWPPYFCLPIETHSTSIIVSRILNCWELRPFLSFGCHLGPPWVGPLPAW